jgi:hypothetical protein
MYNLASLFRDWRFLKCPAIANASNTISNFDEPTLQNMRLSGLLRFVLPNGKAACNAFVLPGDNEPLLGAIPMEEMDVMIHPQRQELIVNPEHPTMRY